MDNLGKNEKMLWTIEPIDLKQNETIFNGKTLFYEKIDWRTLNNIINSGINIQYDIDWCREWKVNTTDSLTHLKHIRANVNNGYLVVKPCINTSIKYGRAWFGNGILSVSQICREIRGLLVGDTLVDLDIVNAHFSILKNICSKSNIDKNRYSNISYYCDNRNTVIDTTIDKCFGKSIPYKQSRYAVKQLFIRILYLGGLRGWANDFNVDIDIVLQNDFLVSLSNELKSLFIDFLVPANRDIYNKLESTINRQKKRAETKRNRGAELTKHDLKCLHKNPLSSFASKFLQNWERKIIEPIMVNVKDILSLKKMFFGYAYDGFTMEKNHFEDLTDTLDISVVDWFSQIIYDLYGFDIDFDIKPFDTSKKEELERLIKERGVVINTDYKDTFNKDYMHSLPSYVERKDYWERFFLKITNETGFIKREFEVKIDKKNFKPYLDQTIQTFNEKTLVESFKEIQSGKYSKNSTDKEPKPTSFVKEWLVDPDMSTKKTTNFIPSNNPPDKVFQHEDILNTFCGYNPSLWNIDTDCDSFKNAQTKLHTVLNVMSNVVGGTEEFKQFIMLMSWVIKYPNKKLPYSVLIKSKEGEGKNWLLYWFSQIIGKEHFISTSNINDIVGDHAEGLNHKILVNLNEMDFSSTKGKMNHLKSIITEDTIRVNPKYLRPYDIDNFAFVVISTNEELSIKINLLHGDRRWYIFQGNAKNKHISKQQWERLWEVLEDPFFVRAFYDYLINLDCEGWNFKHAKFINSTKKPYQQLIVHYTPTEILFLEHYILSKQFDSSLDFDYETEEEKEDMEQKTEQENIYVNDYHNTNDSPFYESHSFKQPTTIDCTSLYKSYIKFCRDYGFKLQAENKSIKSFMCKINEIGIPITKGRNRIHRTTLNFIPAEIYCYLGNKNYICIDTESTWYNDYTNNITVENTQTKDMFSFLNEL